MGVIERCPAGRVIEPRAVTAGRGVDDWFHADDGSHCEHRIELARVEEQLRGAVDLLREVEPWVVWPEHVPMEQRERWARAVASVVGGQ